MAILQEKPNDPEAFRLLGEVKFALKDYEGSVAAYKSSSKVCLCTHITTYLLTIDHIMLVYDLDIEIE